MQTAFSLSLVEPVDAVEVDYGDCKFFQIVCPICREAVFKVGNANTKRQYFSHYPQSKADVQECERRVAGISREAITEWATFQRGQTLAGFLKVFQEIQIGLYANRKPDRAADVMQRINHLQYRPMFQKFVEIMQKFMLYQSKPPFPSTYDTLKVTEIKTKLFADAKTAFAREKRIRFAADFFDHLLAANSLGGFRFLVAFNIIDGLLDNPLELAGNFETEESEQFFRKHYDAFADLMRRKDKKFRAIVYGDDVEELIGLLTGMIFSSLCQEVLMMILEYVALAKTSPDVLFARMNLNR